ncbi:VOC family protein [Nocardioides speluncae]|uniref:VOC family protein n=1 Tax=Nocardioides speluncae TaxID=2670337 RepID=UPI000D696C7A|nr:VOC family protein [Nocardioides speluncae]
MPLDHLGIGVPDMESARAYYDALAPLVGFVPFGSGDGWFAYAPDGDTGVQLFFYPAQSDAAYDGDATGLQHLCFRVGTRAEVDAAHAWAVAGGDQILHPPRVFAEYHPLHYATYWLEPRGFKLEVVSFANP